MVKRFDVVKIIKHNHELFYLNIKFVVKRVVTHRALLGKLYDEITFTDEKRNVVEVFNTIDLDGYGYRWDDPPNMVCFWEDNLGPA